MARYKFPGVWRDKFGHVVNAGGVSVFLEGGVTAASVYAASSGGTAVNSVLSGTDGKFLFWVDTNDYTPTQKFCLVLSKDGFSTSTYDSLAIFPPLATGLLTKDVSGNSDITLTLGEYTNNILSFIGVLTGNIDIYLVGTPTLIWLVKNNTTGSFTLSVRSTGQISTKPTVTQGYKCFLTNDGTSITRVTADVADS